MDLNQSGTTHEQPKNTVESPADRSTFPVIRISGYSKEAAATRLQVTLTISKCNTVAVRHRITVRFTGRDVQRGDTA